MWLTALEVSEFKRKELQNTAPGVFHKCAGPLRRKRSRVGEVWRGQFAKHDGRVFPRGVVRSLPEVYQPEVGLSPKVEQLRGRSIRHAQPV